MPFAFNAMGRTSIRASRQGAVLRDRPDTIVSHQVRDPPFGACRSGGRHTLEGDRPMGKKKRERQSHNKEMGARGEDAAARYLELLGYEVLERNWTCPAGEADIIARDECTLVFVEVKTRTSFEKGFPSEAVGPEKRARYEQIACWYLRDYECVDIPVRFDVVALLVVAHDRAFVRHYRGAFEAGW